MFLYQITYVNNYSDRQERVTDTICADHEYFNGRIQYLTALHKHTDAKLYLTIWQDGKSITEYYVEMYFMKFHRNYGTAFPKFEEHVKKLMNITEEE